VRDFERKYFELLKIYSQELDDVSTIFLKHKANVPIHYNMAPVTGAVAWIHELKERVGKAMEKLKTVSFFFTTSYSYAS
jgi:dynein heavy chain